MNLFRPDRFVAGLADIDAAQLLRDGVLGAIIDLDDTIVGYRHPRPLPAVSSWIERASEAGLKIIIVSNNTRAWVGEVAGLFRVAFVHKALKPLPVGLRRAVGILGLQPREIVVIGDQLFTDVLGAKLLGLRVILTEPIVARAGGPMRMLRFFERLVLGPPQRNARLRDRPPAAHRSHDPQQDHASDERHDDAPNVDAGGADVAEQVE